MAAYSADSAARFTIPIEEFTFLLRPMRDGRILLDSPLLAELDDPSGTTFLYRPLGLHRAALVQLLSVSEAAYVEIAT